MEVTTIVIFGTLGMLILSISIVAFIFINQKKLMARDLKIQKMQAEYQKDLLRATIEAQEKERRRISEDLHDDIGAMLSTIKLSVIGMIRGTDLNEKQAFKLKSTRELIDETVGNVRRLSRDLLPATLEEFGLVYALQQLLEKIEANTGLQVVFRHSVYKYRLESIVELALYRIVQELCNNIIKHANATRIEVSMEQTKMDLKMIVMDNGDGFLNNQMGKYQSKSAGLGLKNIESRLNMINATIKYALDPTKGTKVTINLGYIFNKFN